MRREPGPPSLHEKRTSPLKPTNGLNGPPRKRTSPQASERLEWATPRLWFGYAGVNGCSLGDVRGSGMMLRPMNREYHKGYSQELHREMELLVFGHAGTPLLVFPTSMGKFFEYEDRGMVGALGGKIERGELQVFCPDGIDTESWYNKGVHPRVRVLRHLQYERYILHEFVPFIRWKNQTPRLAVTGCSFGGYHAVNFAFKHPDVVTHCVSMSGSFDIHQFLDGYYDNDCYFNNT